MFLKIFTAVGLAAITVVIYYGAMSIHISVSHAHKAVEQHEERLNRRIREATEGEAAGVQGAPASATQQQKAPSL